MTSIYPHFTQKRAASHRGMGLPLQFALIGGLIMLAAMVVAGHFTSQVVSRATIESSAASSALFMDSLIAPLVQSLRSQDRLPAESIEALDQILGSDPFESRFPHVEIWKEGGLVVYSRTPELIGRRFEPPEGLRAALRGDVAAFYTDLEAGEHIARDFTQSFLEFYVPVREHNAGRIIAVAEIHEVPGPLEAKLWQVQVLSWLSVAGAALVIMLGLVGVVYRASRMIVRQRDDLHQRMTEIERVSRLNRLLREKAQRASSRVSELTEANLRRIGADLHDGPAQLIGLASLTVEHVRRARNGSARMRELDKIELALRDALADIRTISRGLMSPEIEHLSLCEVVDRVVRAHEQRTGSGVLVDCRVEPERLSHAIKLCVYRFVQEGLSNAFRHARGMGQAVDCILAEGRLSVTVRDAGSGGDTRFERDRDGHGLGLAGLRERVESLGGTFQFQTTVGAGTTVAMSLWTQEIADA